MANNQGTIFARDDTFFGVCEALGEDFGFNPFFLRLALGVGLIWNPLAMVAVYAALGLLVAAVRFIAPDPRSVDAIEGGLTSVEAPVAGDARAEHALGTQPLRPAAA